MCLGCFSDMFSQNLTCYQPLAQARVLNMLDEENLDVEERKEDQDDADISEDEYVLTSYLSNILIIMHARYIIVYFFKKNPCE